MKGFLCYNISYMKRNILIIILVLLIALFGFYFYNFFKKQDTLKPMVNMSNPASAFCINNGGTLASGTCTFPTREACGEWGVFLGACSVEGLISANTFASEDGKEIQIGFFLKEDRAMLNATDFGISNYELKSAVSASGARYLSTDNRIEFWEHQGEATLSLDGKEIFKGKNIKQYSKESDPNWADFTGSKILLGERAEYENLNPQEKGLVNRYLDSLPQDEYLPNAFYCVLKYYDVKTVLLGCNLEKPGIPLYIFNRDTLELIHKNKNSLDLTLTENENYLVSTCYTQYESLCYYKKGADQFLTVPNSELKDKNQTYTFHGSPGGDFYNIEITDNKVKATVYDKNKPTGQFENVKIKDLEFVLP